MLWVCADGSSGALPQNRRTGDLTEGPISAPEPISHGGAEKLTRGGMDALRHRPRLPVCSDPRGPGTFCLWHDFYSTIVRDNLSATAPIDQPFLSLWKTQVQSPLSPRAGECCHRKLGLCPLCCIPVEQAAREARPSGAPLRASGLQRLLSRGACSSIAARHSGETAECTSRQSAENTTKSSFAQCVSVLRTSRNHLITP